MNAADIELLIARVLSGELDAYAGLVRAHQQDVWRVVAAMLYDPDKTEDLVQTTFVNAYRQLDRFEPGRDFGRWLKGIARNLVRHELRTRGRDDRRLELYRHQLESHYDDPGAAEATEQLAEALAACEQKLPADAVELVDLRYRRALDFGQIATHVGRTVGATRQQLARIRLALRDCIQKQLVRP